MKLDIRTKLFIGLGILSLLIVILWASASFFLTDLSQTSAAILKDNNRTVVYAQDMTNALNRIKLSQEQILFSSDPDSSAYNRHENAKQDFQDNLDLQNQNITESGEQALVNELSKNYTSFISFFEERPADIDNAGGYLLQLNEFYHALERNIFQLSAMNLDAIVAKNEASQESATQTLIYMSFVGGLCTLLAIAMLLRFPGFISGPLTQLMNNIKEIAKRNYSVQLEYDKQDEFGELADAFNSMAEKLQEFETSNLAKIKHEKQRIEAVINTVSDAMIGLDSQMKILFVNKKATELMELKEEKLLGKYAPDVASYNDLLRDLIKDLYDDDEEDEILKIVENGKEVYYAKEHISVYSRDQKDQIIGTLLTLKNITRFHELDQAKTNFIAVVSHELKTPIASINMSSKLLNDSRVGTLNDEQRELVASITKDANRMKRATAELLDLSKIETGNIQLDVQKVKPSDIIEYSYETMIMQAIQSDIELSINLEEDLPFVRADLQKTTWVLINLISNAIRYTPSNGDVTLGAKKQNDKVVFSVSDTGSGMPAEYLDKIFDKYFQIPKANEKETGSGLGLSIAKEFITAQGGKIWAESSLGEGSVFYFNLPKF